MNNAADHLWMHFTRMSSYADHPVPTIERGLGAYIWDTDGRKYLDALSGLFVVQAGHGRDDIAELVARMPEVTSAYTVTGEANAILHLRVEDIEHLQRALEAIRGEGVVQQTRSHIVLTRLTPG